MARHKANSLSAQNTFGDALALVRGGVLTLSGTWVATVSLQRKDANAGTWHDVTNNSGTATTFTGNGTYTVDPNLIDALYRWGIKTGNYTSGTVVGVFEAR